MTIEVNSLLPGKIYEFNHNGPTGNITLKKDDEVITREFSINRIFYDERMYKAFIKELNESVNDDVYIIIHDDSFLTEGLNTFLIFGKRLLIFKLEM